MAIGAGIQKDHGNAGKIPETANDKDNAAALPEPRVCVS